MEQYLRAFTHQYPQTWASFLIWAELWYNTSVHTSTGMSPFQAMYGKPPRPIQTFLPGSSSIEAVETELTTKDDILKHLKRNLLKAHKRMKNQVDKHRRKLSFQVGDLVMVKLQPYRQQSVA